MATEIHGPEYVNKDENGSETNSGKFLNQR